MTRALKPLEQRMAETQAKKARLNEQLKMLEQKQKAIDLRRRAKAEKIFIRTMLEQLPANPALGEALNTVLHSAPIKDEDRELVFWLLGQLSSPAEIDSPAACAA